MRDNPQARANRMRLGVDVAIGPGTDRRQGASRCAMKSPEIDRHNNNDRTVVGDA